MSASIWTVSCLGISMGLILEFTRIHMYLYMLFIPRGKILFKKRRKSKKKRKKSLTVPIDQTGRHALVSLTSSTLQIPSAFRCPEMTAIYALLCNALATDNPSTYRKLSKEMHS